MSYGVVIRDNRSENVIDLNSDNYKVKSIIIAEKNTSGSEIIEGFSKSSSLVFYRPGDNRLHTLTVNNNGVSWTAPVDTQDYDSSIIILQK